MLPPCCRRLAVGGVLPEHCLPQVIIVEQHFIPGLCLQWHTRASMLVAVVAFMKCIYHAGSAPDRTFSLRAVFPPSVCQGGMFELLYVNFQSAPRDAFSVRRWCCL